MKTAAAVVDEQSSVKLRKLIETSKKEIASTSYEEEEVEELSRQRRELDLLTKRSIRFQETLVKILFCLIISLIGFGVVKAVFNNIIGDSTETYIIEKEGVTNDY